jgi:hypothetical protein
MKLSPNGKKLVMGGYSFFELYDFDASTGIVSNPLLLTNALSAYGCEFSPDGTKLYTSSIQMHRIWQWDMCAGSNTAIVASQFTIATTQGPIGQLQLAPDGKIYGARFYKPDLAVINNPNASGPACNLVELAQSVAPQLSLYGLPGFVTSYFKTSPAPFTYTASCLSGTFAAPAPSTVNVGCGASNYSVNSVSWHFGDPSSGTANTSTLSNATHSFTSGGSFTVMQINYYNCSSDTVKTVINIPGKPEVNVAGTFTVCKGDRRVYTASGGTIYSWSGSIVNTPTISLSPTVTTVYTVTGSASPDCASAKSFTVTVNNCTALNDHDLPVHLRIYPTAGTGVYTLDADRPISLSIYNQTGSAVFSAHFEAGKHTIDLSGNNSGIYLARPAASTLKSVRIIKTD